MFEDDNVEIKIGTMSGQEFVNPSLKPNCVSLKIIILSPRLQQIVPAFERTQLYELNFTLSKSRRFLLFVNCLCLITKWDCFLILFQVIMKMS